MGEKGGTGGWSIWFVWFLLFIAPKKLEKLNKPEQPERTTQLALAVTRSFTRVFFWRAFTIPKKFSVLGLPCGASMRCRLLLGLLSVLAHSSNPTVALTRSRFSASERSNFSLSCGRAIHGVHDFMTEFCSYPLYYPLSRVLPSFAILLPAPDRGTRFAQQPSTRATKGGSCRGSRRDTAVPHR